MSSPSYTASEMMFFFLQTGTDVMVLYPLEGAVRSLLRRILKGRSEFPNDFKKLISSLKHLMALSAHRKPQIWFFV